MNRLRETFRLEAEEHLRAVSHALLELEKCAVEEKRAEWVEKAFREVHSLKGAARAVNLPVIERLCRSLEGAFSALKHQQTQLSEELLRVLDAATRILEELLSATVAGSAALPATEAVIEQLERAQRAPTPGAPATEAAILLPARPLRAEEPSAAVAEGSALAETVRIPVARLSALMLQVEELRGPKLMAAQRALELRALGAPLAVWKKLRSRLAPDLRQLRLEGRNTGNGTTGNSKTWLSLARLLDFLERTDAAVGELENRSLSLAHASEVDQRVLAGMVDGLLDDVKRVLMLPMSTLLEGFPRLVRDLARDQSKQVELEISGAEIEADRRILQELKSPLVHLARNVMDHGIETKEERTSRGKPAVGKVRMAVTALEGNKFEVVVEDDGGGIDLARTREAAVRAGRISREDSEHLSEPESLSLIFESGITTTPILTDLSGRGLGLTIVREKVERLGGTVTVTTRPGAGTSFRIELPLALTTFRGVVVAVSDSLFIVPIASIERVLRVFRAEIRTVENRETVVTEGHAVSLLRLAEVLGLGSNKPATAADGWVYVLVLAAAGKRMAFAVDEIVGEQEVVVKSLGRDLAHLSGLAGATVLSSGRVVPILSLPDLMKASLEASPRQAAPGTSEETEERRVCSVLVAEDSITARALLKNILESAGYRVETAVDGAEAFTLLKTKQFHLLVSDVEMPRMNGFDLTAKIRADKALAELPVVLVTALESREDREHGIDAGANAYIVKSSFDHSNLLEVVDRLL